MKPCLLFQNWISFIALLNKESEKAKSNSFFVLLELNLKAFIIILVNRTYMKKAFDNFLKRTVFEYIAIAGMVITSILVLIMAITWSVDLGKGIAFFTDSERKELVAYEYVVMIMFYIAGIFVLVLAIYEAFFKEPTKNKKESHKEFVDGEAIDVSDTVTQQAEQTEDITKLKEEIDKINQEDK